MRVKKLTTEIRRIEVHHSSLNNSTKIQVTNFPFQHSISCLFHNLARDLKAQMSFLEVASSFKQCSCGK